MTITMEVLATMEKKIVETTDLMGLAPIDTTPQYEPWDEGLEFIDTEDNHHDFWEKLIEVMGLPTDVAPDLKFINLEEDDEALEEQHERYLRFVKRIKGFVKFFTGK